MNRFDGTYIILVNFKSWKDTIECLESVLKSNNQNFKVIIVDNSPDLESCRHIQNWARGIFQVDKTLFPNLVFPASTPIPMKVVNEELLKQGERYSDKILLVRAKRNNGFAAANNIALNYLMKHNLGRHYWILNNDTVVHPATLDHLLTAKKNSGIDLIGSVLYEYYDPETVQSVGGLYQPIFGRIKLIKKLGVECDYPIGASMFITNRFFKEVGPMCEDYFLFFEEYDWVLRAKKKGMDFLIENKARIYHKGGGAIGNRSTLSDFYGIKSKLLFNKKHFPNTYFLFCLIFGSLYSFNRVRRGQIGKVLLLFKLLRKPNLQFNEVKHK